MKQIYKLINIAAIGILFSSISFAQITYVNTNATGTGNGTTWADAFTELQTALDAATSGEIWVAAGTYTPSNTSLDTFNTFSVDKEIAIYGGFEGSETSIEERVLDQNTTILSGDILGNDIDNSFTTNKEDNIFHIMYIDADNTSKIILDGLTFKGGHTRSESTNPEITWRGGAIYSLNTIDVRNCNFNNNFARSGAAIYLSPEIGGGNGSIFDNCVVEKNSCVTQAAGFFLNTVNDVTITNSLFQNNLTNRGALYPIFCQNLLVDNCIFRNNIPTTSTNFGGAMFIWNSKGTLKDCTFESNSSGNGAAIHIDGREEAVSVAENFIFDNCTFTGNSASDFGGGAFRSFTASFTMKDCDFLNNNAPNGGAMFTTGPGQEVIEFNNTFEGNTADFGGSQACYGLYSNYTLSKNTYTGNAANSGGGALINGFGANVVVDSCDFISNIANSGGAMFLQNDTTNVEIYHSDFTENTVAGGNGGAINIISPVTLTIDNCNFLSNIADFGGAINGAENLVDVIEGFVHISNSTFSLNTASTQGAGISLVDLDLEMTNTVVSTNFNTGVGAGGGLSLNSTANKNVTFNITNSTIADNFALLGGGLSAFSEDETSNCIINLQNNIFSNEGLNYEVEAGDITIASNGGNISTDATLENILTGSGDINNSEDVMFVDGANYDFQLLDNSPAINIGVAQGAPETDILGNPRVGSPDAGAYENQDPLSIEVIDNVGQLKMYPNPVISSSTVSLSNDWSANIQISILDISGKQIRVFSILKSNQSLHAQLDLKDLSAGKYFLTAQSNDQKIATSFVKL